MRIAAGIVGILVGISSLSYIGLFGGLLGSATSWLGSGPWSHGDSTVTNLGQMISLLSYLSGLLAIAGGIVAFSNTRVGGIILAASAFSHWYLLGFGVIGKVFILPIGVAAAFAFFAARSGLQSAPAMSSGNASSQTSNHTSNANTPFDRAKWNALLQYDKDISAVAEKLKPLGEKWVDELASSYLALNDKTYLPEIERKIVVAARAEAEDNERQRIYREEQQKASLQAQERLAEARRKQFELWRDRLWKYKVVVGGILLGLVVGGGYWSYQKQETEKLIAAERQRETEARAKAAKEKQFTFVGGFSCDSANRAADPSSCMYSVELWRDPVAGIVGHVDYPVMEADTPAGLVEQVKYNSSNGTLSFQATLPLGGWDGVHQDHQILEFVGKLTVDTLKGTFTLRPEKKGARGGSEMAVVLKKGNSNSSSEYANIIAWQQNYSIPILKFRGPK